MLITACIGFAALVQGSAAEEFFPLTPGTKWVYREEGKFIAGSYVDEVGRPVEIGGEKATPIVTSQDGKALETVYYRAAGDSIYIVAYDPKLPLDPPRPLFTVGEQKQVWEYVGLTPMMRDPIPLKMKGEAILRGRRKALDREVDCLEVKFEAQLGRSEADVIYSKQTAYYGKGIGLIEMTEKATVGKRTEERKIRLAEFKPADK